MIRPDIPALRHGANRQRGQIIVMVGLTMIVLVGIVGLALDSGRGYGVKAKLNAAVDAGSIAAARAIAIGASDSERIANAQAAAQRYFDLNFPADYQGAVRPVPSVQATRDPTTRRWTVTVSATAEMPTTFARVLGRTELDVYASGTAIRRRLDVMMVLDTSGSLDSPPSPAGTFATLKTSAVNGFVNKFSPDDDRIGLVSFSSGAVIDLPIRKAPPPADGRGFDKTAMVNAINALAVGGATASAEGVSQAIAELDAIPAALRSDLRVILFFSDGAPNIVSGVFPRQGGGTRTGNLYSEADATGPVQPASYWVGRSADWPGIVPAGCGTRTRATPTTGSSTSPDFRPSGAAESRSPAIGRRGADRRRTRLREQPVQRKQGSAQHGREHREHRRGAAAPIHVYSIGLGARLNSLEIASDCGYGPSEYGANILKRLANTSDSDTFDAAQPKGLYCFAATASDLERCFSAIASEVLRLAI